MHTYMLDVANRFDTIPHLACNTAWIDSTWLEDQKIWRITLQDMTTREIKVQECRVLISATGHMIDPKKFNVEGLEEFKGQIVHSSKWTKDTDLKGKNVVVLGNGSVYYWSGDI